MMTYTVFIEGREVAEMKTEWVMEDEDINNLKMLFAKMYKIHYLLVSLESKFED